jgi:threonine/homoserine/homoserine lactone efflux protein
MSETLSGVVFGLVAGLTPGRLLVLVLQQTLCYGIRAGLKVAGVPVLTDPLVIGVALVALNQMGDLDGVVGGACL